MPAGISYPSRTRGVGQDWGTENAAKGRKRADSRMQAPRSVGVVVHEERRYALRVAGLEEWIWISDRTAF